MSTKKQALMRQLRAARKEKGISQSRLAEMVDLPQSHISSIENGKVDVRSSNLIEMARALDLEPVLIPRRYLSAVKAFLSHRKAAGSEYIPPFSLIEDEDD